MEIKWIKCQSVTTGGKKFFLYGRSDIHAYHIVWDRIDKAYHCQIDSETQAKFELLNDALSFFRI